MSKNNNSKRGKYSSNTNYNNYNNSYNNYNNNYNNNYDESNKNYDENNENTEEYQEDNTGGGHFYYNRKKHTEGGFHKKGYVGQNKNKREYYQNNPNEKHSYKVKEAFTNQKKQEEKEHFDSLQQDILDVDNLSLEKRLEIYLKEEKRETEKEDNELRDLMKGIDISQQEKLLSEITRKDVTSVKGKNNEGNVLFKILSKNFKLQQNPELLGSIISTLEKAGNTQEEQQTMSDELINLLGYEDIETVFALTENRKDIVELVSVARKIVEDSEREQTSTKNKNNDKLLVNLDVYGKIDSTGVKDGSPDPMPSLWDEDRRVFTDAHKLFDPDEEASITKSKPNFLKRMSDYYPKPTTALDIINYGIDNTDFATNAFAEVLSMLSNSKELKTMVLIDEYNELFKESDYLSYKFANKHKGKIPPYAMSLVRLIMSLDGHLSYNFFKVFALSQSRYQRHTVNPSMLNMSYNFSYCVPNLKLNDVRYAVNYYNIIGLGYTKFNEKDILYLYTVSQGNWKELQHFVKFPTSTAPSHKAYIERKIVQRELANTNMEIKKMLRLKGVEKNKKIRGKVEEMRKFYHQFDDYI